MLNAILDRNRLMFKKIILKNSTFEPTRYTSSAEGSSSGSEKML